MRNGRVLVNADPLERYGKVAAAFARGNSMNLVDDDGARGRQHDAPGFGAEQDIERLQVVTTI